MIRAESLNGQRTTAMEMTAAKQIYEPAAIDGWAMDIYTVSQKNVPTLKRYSSK